MTIFGVYFDEPAYFLALLLLPLLAYRAWTLAGRGRVPIPSRQAVAALPSVKASLWWLPDALRTLAIAALIVAAARPQVRGEETVTGEGVDIMLALDMSSSMNAIDMSASELQALLADDQVPPNRFDVARDILKQFIVARNRLSTDRIGLTIFGAAAWLKYPLTHDHARLIAALNGLVLDSGVHDQRSGRCTNACTISGGATAIGDALGRAFNRLRRSSSASRIIILITDGAQKGSTVDARAIARHIRDLPDGERVPVYTFLVGDQEQHWVPERDPFGRLLLSSRDTPRYVRPRTPFTVDPTLLQEVASQTGGKFYASYNAEKFKEDVSDLEQTVFSADIDRKRHDVFPWPLLVALGLVAVEWGLRFSLYRSVV